jgi:hypothetical protein
MLGDAFLQQGGKRGFISGNLHEVIIYEGISCSLLSRAGSWGQ